MKTAISIPDDLYLRADRFARQLGKSRSQLYRDAIADYLDRRETTSITAALDEVVDVVARDPDLEDERTWLGAAARAALAHDEW